MDQKNISELREDPSPEAAAEIQRRYRIVFPNGREASVKGMGRMLQLYSYVANTAIRVYLNHFNNSDDGELYHDTLPIIYDTIRDRLVVPGRGLPSNEPLAENEQEYGYEIQIQQMDALRSLPDRYAHAHGLISNDHRDRATPYAIVSSVLNSYWIETADDADEYWEEEGEVRLPGPPTVENAPPLAHEIYRMSSERKERLNDKLWGIRNALTMAPDADMANEQVNKLLGMWDRYSIAYTGQPLQVTPIAQPTPPQLPERAQQVQQAQQTEQQLQAREQQRRQNRAQRIETFPARFAELVARRARERQERQRQQAQERERWARQRAQAQERREQEYARFEREQNQRAATQLATERRLPPVPQPTAEEMHEYYRSVLGEAYKELQVFDMIMQDEVPFSDYIAEDADNLVIVVKTKETVPPMIYTTLKSHVQSILPLYECDQPDTKRKMYDRAYINLSTTGCPCAGVADYTVVQWLLKSPYQVLAFRLTPEQTKTLVSHGVRYLERSYVSDAHCQSGTQQSYYATYVPGPVHY